MRRPPAAPEVVGSSDGTAPASGNGYLFPLSFAQQRLWILDQLAPGGTLYNLRCAVRLPQHVDAPALQRAVNAVVERHEALRTVFHVVDGEPGQLVLPAMPVRLQCYDLRRLPSVRRETAAAELAAQLAERPFDLARGPLLRTMLIWLGTAEYVLVIGLHHIVADGWSMGVLAEELGAHYEGFVSGRPADLAPLPVQYADFAVWQREWLAGERLAEQVGFWRTALQELPGLGLPLDRPRPAVQAHRGSGFAFELPSEVVDGLGRVARESQATLFMVLLAGFGAVLGRWCRQDDVVVGAPIAGRNRAELEGLIGFFVNTLVLRVDLSGDPSFRDLVGRVREVALGAYAHADLPFEKLVEELAPQRDLSRNPLFQVTFQLFESPSTPDAVGAQAGLEIPVTSSLFDLRVDMWPAPAGLSGRVEFDTDLFDRSSIEWLLERFGWFLEQVAADPERPLASVSLAPPAQQRLLRGWNETGAEVPEGCVHEAVAARALAEPDAVAVADGEGEWSYRELEAHANRLAHRLIELEVGAGGLVALCVERGRRFMAAALAALKAGAAYLPLDPAYPPARLAHVLADAAPAVLLTTGELAARLPVEEPTQVLALDAWPEGGEHDPGVAVAPGDAAYVIYTSGSTGTPKGVVIEHRSLMNLVAWHRRAYAIEPPERGSQIASVGFDAAVWETWPYLCAGASVHVCDDATRADADHLLGWLDEHGITVSFIPTPLAELLLAKPWPEGARLRYLLTGGDTLRSYANPAHPYTLVNHYGPTESTVVTSASAVPAEPAPGRLPPIGAPIANTTCYVVDHRGAPTGPGAPGELWIGGTGLARGYHDDPELTAERFVQNPFEASPPRLYRTGDLVRWNPDGTLTFLGRTDDQIKIRGYRIEPREIETLLTQHPRIAHAIVTAQRNPTTDTPQLTAYVTSDGRGEDHERQVRHWHSLYEQIYAGQDGGDPEFDIRGWNSSYDGTPLGEAVLREQVEHTVSRIAATEPRRILEIGCGTGLLLFRLAGDCERYCATDFSAAALARVRKRVIERGWAQVELLEREGDQLSDLDGEDFDVVVLNSVVQYFPEAGYLERVLKAAMACLRPGGAVFLGDVRNHALLEAFHTSVELAGAPADLPAAELRRRVTRRMETEQELLLDPAWFTRFARACAEPVAVAASPRRGSDHNELTRFRYDVVLTLTAERPAPPPEAWLDWEADELDFAGLARRVAEAAGPIAVRGIPSARLDGCVRAQRALAAAADELSAGALREMLGAEERGVDPEHLWALSNGNAVEVGWHGSGETGRYDMVAAPLASGAALPPPPNVPDRPLSNDPLHHDSRVVAEVREWLQERLPEQMVPAAIVALEEIPLTEHGKVDLSALVPPDGSPAAPAAGYVAPANATERRLASLWAQTLGLDGVGVHDNFFELGGDSILSIKLASRAAEAGIYFTTRQLFQHQTVADLARVVSSTPRIEAEQGPVVGTIPLTPIQHWLLEQDLAQPHHFNQATLLPVPRGVNAKLLVRALHAVVLHHDALHLRFTRVDGSWEQRGELPDRELPVASADLSALPAEAVPAALERACGRLQATLSLDQALVRVGLFKLGAAEPRRLLIAIHHLAVDGVSWGILVEDLWRAYGQLAEGLPVRLPPKTTSFRRWGHRLVERAATPAATEQAAFWLEQLGEVQALPRDLPGDENTVAITRSTRTALTPEETDDLLRRLLAERSVEINEVLLYAFARALGRWTGESRVTIAVEGHGREPLFDDVDLSRTVGWFTSMFPLALRLPDEANPVLGLAEVAEQVRRVPERGVGYGLLRYLTPDAEVRDALAAARWPEVSFNYLGQLDDGPPDPLRDRTGPDRSPAGTRPHLLEVNGAVTGGRLEFDLYYSSAIHREATIRELGETFMAELRGLLATLAPTTRPDAPDTGAVSARDLETLLARLADEGEAHP